MLVDYYTDTREDTIDAEEYQLYEMIMEYRASLGLPSIPLSKALTITASRHVVDTVHNQGGYDGHNWSDATYDSSDPSTYPVIWDAPERLGTGYTDNGFEISTGYLGDPFSVPNMTAALALENWQGSGPHDDVITQQGPWDQDWQAIGIAIYESVSHVWFGHSADAAGLPAFEPLVGPDDGDDMQVPDDGDDAQIPDDGDDAQIPDDGDDAQVPDDGDDAQVPDDGDDAQVPDDGDDAQVPDDGDDAQVPDDGDDAQVPDDGDDAQVPDDNGVIHGTANADNLLGTNKNDIIAGGAEADVLHGGAGDDVLFAGSDQSEVGTGDTARYDGRAGDFEIRGGIDYAVVTGPNGDRDKIFGVEFLQFDDGTVTLRAGSALDGAGAPEDFVVAERVALLYEAALNRDGNIDLPGLNFYIDVTDRDELTDEFLAQNLMTSPEFTQSFGDVDALSNAAFLEQIYLNVLDRASDAAGLQFYLDLLDAGTISKALALADIAVSPENAAESTSILMGLYEGSDGAWGFL